MTKFVDATALVEDERIQQIAAAVLEGQRVGFITDTEPGKADRYVEKLKALVPSIVVFARHAGPVPKTVFLRVGMPVFMSASSNKRMH